MIGIEELRQENSELKKELEVQNRELKIEAALERVRARTMAMQKSEELPEAAKLLFQQVQAFGLPVISCGYNIFEKDDLVCTAWMSDSSGSIHPSFTIPLTESPTFIRFRESKQKGETFYAEEVSGEALATHYRYMVSLPSFREIAEGFQKAGFSLPTYQVTYVVNFSQGNLVFVITQPVHEAWDIFQRFARIFEQTYTRFLDLQKAEEQAREAQIQLALERVRARTMAMQKSEELTEAARLLFEQVQTLGMPAWSAGYCIFDEDKQGVTIWMSSDGVLQPPFRAPLTEEASFIRMREAYERGETFYVEEVGDEELRMRYQYLRTLPVVGEMLDTIIDAGHPLPTFQIFHFVYFSQGYLLFITYEPVPEAHDLFKRFGKVFDQTYTRFLDLQKAEAQAREAQIEVAVERVRAKALAMHRSEEIMSVVQTLRHELGRLNIDGIFAASIHLKQDDGSVRLWDITINDVLDNAPSSSWDFNFRLEEMHPRLYIKRIWDATEKYFVFEQDEHDFPILIEWVRQFKKEDADEIDRAIKEYNIKSTWFAAIQLSYGRMNIELMVPPSAEIESILSKIGAAFDLAYKRFLDLQKAEAQTREAKIEASLERVRAKALAMHKSQDLQHAAATVFEELEKTEPQILRCGIAILDPSKPRADVWIAVKGKEGHTIEVSGNEPLDTHPMLRNAYEAWKRHEDYSYQLQGDEVMQYYKSMAVNEFQAPVSESYRTGTLAHAQCYFNGVFTHGSLFVFLNQFCSEAVIALVKRFVNVFDLAYKRYLDLQKAEAQAREAQIELAMERVRARTMAMQKSDELADVATLLFKQVSELGTKAWTTGFNVWSDDNNYWTDYVTNPQGGFIEPYTIDTTKHSAFANVSEAKKKGEEFYVQHQEGEMLKDTYRHLSTFADKNQFDKILEGGFQFPTQQFDHFVFGSKVSLLFITYEPVPEAYHIFKRFGKVFEQTYTRFLDLQRAEAQAREAQIELALERVRARTMAMQKSEELSEAARLLFQQVQDLDLPVVSCGYNIWEKDEKICTGWMSDESGLLSPPFKIPLTESPLCNRMWESKKKGEHFYAEEVSGEALTDHYRFMLTLPNFKEVADRYQKAGFTLPSYQVNNVVNFSHGNLIFITYKPVPEAYDIFKRFGKVFEQTYTRFLDLQRAEAQAREAKIEAALERVRARTMAMQKSDELEETNMLILRQLESLDISISGIGIHICYSDTPESEAWMWDPLAGKMPKVIYNHTHDRLSEKMYEGWKKGETLYVEEVKGEKLKEHLKYVSSLLPDPTIYEDSILESVLVFHIVYFTYGFFVLATLDHCATEHPVFIRFAKVFEQTYTRFLDLQRAEAQAREATIEAAIERVRSRSMAMHKSDEVMDVAVTVYDQLQKLDFKFGASSAATIIIMDEKTGNMEHC